MKYNRENLKIKDLLKKYNLTYNDILPYSGFSHITRISEELAQPLLPKQEKKYLLAIKKAKEKKKKELQELYED